MVLTLLKGISLIVGDMGCGKTFLLTLLGYWHYLNGETVYSNYPVNFPHVKIDSIKVLENAKDGVVLLDEVHLIADSRTAMRRQNRISSIILLKSRKRKLRFYMTSQRPDLIDRRVRDQVTFWLYPSPVQLIEYNNMLIPTIYVVDIFERTTFNELEKFATIRVNLEKLGSIDKILKIYNLYDTEAEPYEIKTEEPKKKREN